MVVVAMMSLELPSHGNAYQQLFEGQGKSNAGLPKYSGAASAMGAKATKKLVKGGELIPTEKTFRVYKKYGDLARALEDFESVKYTETLSFKTPNKGPGRAGTIGDRQVILHTTGDTGGPIIDVIKVIERSDSIGRKEIFGKITDRIIYENWSH